MTLLNCLTLIYHLGHIEDGIWNLYYSLYLVRGIYSYITMTEGREKQNLNFSIPRLFPGIKQAVLDSISQKPTSNGYIPALSVPPLTWRILANRPERNERQKKQIFDISICTHPRYAPGRKLLINIACDRPAENITGNFNVRKRLAEKMWHQKPVSP